MGVWDSIKAMVGRKQRSGTGFEVGRWSAAPPRRGSEALIKAYKTMPWLQTIVDTTAEGVAGLHWKVVRPTKPTEAKGFRQKMLAGSLEDRSTRLKSMIDAGEAVEVYDHPLLKLIADPNDQITGREVQKLKQIYLDLVGEAALPLEMRLGVPVGYWPLPPYAVKGLPDYSKPPAERVYTVSFGAAIRQIPESEMLFLRHADPDDPLGRGVGKGFSLGDELDTAEYAARFGKNYFYNNALPAALIGIEGARDADPNVKRWKEELLRDHKGPEAAGKVMVTSGKVTITRLDTDLEKMGLREMQASLNAFVRMNFKVPPEIVGDLTSSNKATAWAAHDALAKNAIVPRGEFLRAEYQKRLMPLLGQEGDVIDFESPIPADREHQLRTMTAFPSEFTGNEARALAGLKPLEGHDEPMKPHPGQAEKPAGPADAEQGGEADTIEEQDQPSNKKAAPADPPWSAAPIV